MNDTNRIEWKRAAREALISGAMASVLSTAALMLAGKRENNAPAGPINGPSQWLYGRKAAHRRRFNLGYTLPGFLIHHLTATGWALLHERVFGRRRATQSRVRQLRNAAITAAVANVVDYRLTPKRLQPGFEAQLSKKSLFGVYAAFALGLALYDLANQHRQTEPREE